MRIRVLLRDLHALTPHFYQPLRPLIGFPKAGEIRRPARPWSCLLALSAVPFQLSINATSYLVHSFQASKGQKPSNSAPSSSSSSVTPSDITPRPANCLETARSLTARALTSRPSTLRSTSTSDLRAFQYLNSQASYPSTCFHATSTILQTRQLYSYHPSIIHFAQHHNQPIRDFSAVLFGINHLYPSLKPQHRSQSVPLLSPRSAQVSKFPVKTKKWEGHRPQHRSQSTPPLPPESAHVRKSPLKTRKWG